MTGDTWEPCCSNLSRSLDDDNGVAMGLRKVKVYDRAANKYRFQAVVYRDRPKGAPLVCRFCPFCGASLQAVK